MPSLADAHHGPECLDDTLLTVALRADFAAYDFAIPVAAQPSTDRPTATRLSRLSEVKTLCMRRSKSVPMDKCIYPRLPLLPREKERDHNFLAWVQNEAAVQALGRIVHHRHCMRAPNPDGGVRYLVPDFLVRTQDATYLVDVYARRHPPRRLRTMMAWCDWANALPPEHRGERAWFFAPLAGLPLRDWHRIGGRLCELLAITRVREGYAISPGYCEFAHKSLLTPQP